MITRHLNDLLARFDRIYLRGYAEIGKAELLLWYGQERLTEKLWRDVLEKWNEQEYGAPLLVGDAQGEGGWILIWGEGLTTANGAWWTDLRKMAGQAIDAEEDGETA